MMKIKIPKTHKVKRTIEKRAPKLVENAKKTLILHGTKTSETVNNVLMQIFHLKRDNAIRYTKKNDNIRPFESGGEVSLEFFSVKTDCSLFVVGDMPLSNKVKGLKREWCESKMKNAAKDDQPKKRKTEQEGKEDTNTTQ